MRWQIRQFFAPLFFGALTAAVQAAVYDVPVGTGGAALRMNIPDSLTVVRGIYFWGNGGTGDGRNRATDPEMLALASTLDFAVIACSGVNPIYTDTTVDVAPVEAAIAQLALVSKHPELVRAPLLPIGHSAGGNTSYNLNAALPARVIATELSKSGNCLPLPSVAALKTPAILIAGEMDTPERITNIRARFFDNRPRGALWAWVEEQGTDHTQLDGPEIAWPFAEMVARLRYPLPGSPVNAPPALVALNESDGWLTDPNSYKTGLADIAPFASYTKDKSTAGWLPNRRAAYIFRAFASYDKATTVATITPANRLVDPGATITYSIGSPGAAWTSIEYYEGDVLLKRVTPANADALSVQFATTTTGYVVLHSLVTFADGRQRTTMPRRALIRIPPLPEAANPSDSAVTWGIADALNLGAITIPGAWKIAAGGGHALVLKNDGTVVAWGGSGFGEAFVPGAVNDVVAVSAQNYSSGALKRDGTVMVWGLSAYNQTQVPAGLSGVRQIAVGERNVLALKSDGTVVGWGWGASSQPSPILPPVTNVSALASGNGISFALKNDGTVVVLEGSAPPPPGLNNVLSLSATKSHVLALKTDGTVVAWGSNTEGESLVPAGLTGVVAVSAGASFSLALKDDGTVVAWGSFGQTAPATPPKSLPPLRAIAAGGFNGVGLVGALPSFASQPQSQLAHPEDYVEFSARAAGAGEFTYQWQKNGAIIPGATADTYAISSVRAADSGIYRVALFDGSVYLTSAGATLAVATDATGDSAPRLANLSTRAVVGTGADILIPGIALNGAGKKQLLVRVSGPALAAAGVSGTLARPQLRLYSDANEIASNTGWSTGTAANTTTLLTAFAQVGLPAFPAGSADCALLAEVDPGVYTATISGVENTTGVALVEVYEFGASTAKLVAISCRARVGTGGDILIPGITIAGTGAKKVIVRVSGPALAAQGVGGVLEKPRLEIYSDAGKVAENTGWNTATNLPDLALATTAVGLTPFAAGSADCALFLTLPTGNYTAKVSGLNNTTGVALVEVYEVP